MTVRHFRDALMSDKMADIYLLECWHNSSQISGANMWAVGGVRLDTVLLILCLNVTSRGHPNFRWPNSVSLNLKMWLILRVRWSTVVMFRDWLVIADTTSLLKLLERSWDPIVLFATPPTLCTCGLYHGFIEVCSASLFNLMSSWSRLIHLEHAEGVGFVTCVLSPVVYLPRT